MSTVKEPRFKNLNEAQKKLIEDKIGSRYMLSKKTGIPENTLVNVWLGYYQTSLGTYKRIAAALEMDVFEFLSLK